MNENLTPSRQVRQTVFATLREAIFEGEKSKISQIEYIVSYVIFHPVMPVKAGIHFLDSRLRGNDKRRQFLKRCIEQIKSIAC